MTDLTKQQQLELQKELESHKDKTQAEKERHVQSYVKRVYNQTLSKEATHKLTSRLASEAHKFHTQFKDRTSAAIIAAFGFLIALAWQDLIKNIVTTHTPTGLFAEYPYLAQLISAVIITLIAVLAIMIVSRWAQKPE